MLSVSTSPVEVAICCCVAAAGDDKVQFALNPFGPTSYEPGRKRPANSGEGQLDARLISFKSPTGPTLNLCVPRTCMATSKS
jgi:hypothetical protein